MWKLQGYVFSVVGAILVVAGVLKVLELHEGAAYASGSVLWVASRVALVEFELFLGTILLIGPVDRWVRLTALVTFATFTCVTSVEVVRGAASCGCFGHVHVDPRFTLAFDIAAVCFLLGTRSAGGSPDGGARTRQRRTAGAVIAIVAACAAMLFVFRGGRAVVAADGVFVTDRLVVLEPSGWIGKRFPVAAQINVGERLMQGKWLIVLFRADCGHCQEAIPRYEAAASVVALSGAKVALIEMPPLDSNGSAVAEGSAALRGRIVDWREWVAQTPVRLEVHNGLVTSVAEGEAAEFPPVNGASEALTK